MTSQALGDMSGTRKRLSIGDRALVAALLLSVVQTTHAVAINFNYDFDDLGFFNLGTQARTALEAAGAFFENRLNDDLDSIIPPGSNTWDPIFTNPSTGATDNSSLTDLNLLNEILIIPGARDLPGALDLAEASRGTFDFDGSFAWFQTLVTRGEGSIVDVTGTTTATETAPWGGSITVDTHTVQIDQETGLFIPRAWNFAVNSGPVGSESDFFSTLVHEIGHILGIGTAVSWDAMIESGEFTGAASAAEFVGNVPVDGAEQHWAEGVTSTVAPGTESYITNGGAAQEAAMDPTLTFGTRKLFTDLDLAALDDIGWELTAIPLPAGFWMLLSGAALLLLRERSPHKV